MPFWNLRLLQVLIVVKACRVGCGITNIDLWSCRISKQPKLIKAKRILQLVQSLYGDFHDEGHNL